MTQSLLLALRTNSQHKNQATLLEDDRPCSPGTGQARQQPALEAEPQHWLAATHQVSPGKQAEGPSSRAGLKVSICTIRTQINGCCFMTLYFGVNCCGEKAYCHRNAKTWLLYYSLHLQRSIFLSVFAASKSPVIMSSLGNCISRYTIVLTQRSLDCDATVQVVEGLECFRWVGNHSE